MQFNIVLFAPTFERNVIHGDHNREMSMVSCLPLPLQSLEHICKESVYGTCSDSVVLAVVWRRWAEGEGPVGGKTAECSEHSVRHVIREHPGTDQNTPEGHFIGPVCTVPDLGKTRPEEKKTRERFGGKSYFSSEASFFGTDWTIHHLVSQPSFLQAKSEIRLLLLCYDSAAGLLLHRADTSGSF